MGNPRLAMSPGFYADGPVKGVAGQEHAAFAVFCDSCRVAKDETPEPI